ncbi:MAG: DNA repair protein RadA [Elusimicrobia bacterium RIFCSPLOWO2_01_FULL_59_12]|nr:MAG: DNA repair protein RadA [Elusimicrobia bacterium RIFCSPLOWO2_01_FULL_59_12]
MKTKSSFRCQECGYATARWLGKCPECEHWNSFVEEQDASAATAAAGRGRRPLTDFSSEVTTLEQITLAPARRTATNLPEFDRVVGGGLVEGSMVLLGGPPGIGKSTLMLQVAEGLCRGQGSGLYISGEESLQQIKDRAHRMGVQAPNLSLVSETELSRMTDIIDKVKPAFCVVDSIQTTYRQDLASSPGSVGQVRECAAEFLRLAKSRGITLFLLGHVTKEGDLAGPRVLEHIVDTVLYFESEREQLFRLLRSHKNRFGPTHEVGVFRMTPKGLAGVASPSEIFLSQRTQAPGSAVVGSLEGSRPLMLEIQALVARTHFGFPKRMVTGLDYNRTLLLIAVLEKRLGLHLENEDVYVNVVGGLRVKEPAVDLGVAVAIASAHRNQALDPHTLWIGEVGLGGEVRAVGALPLRLMEASQLGFKRAVVPQQSLRDSARECRAMKLEIHGISTVSEALEEVLALERQATL